MSDKTRGRILLVAGILIGVILGYSIFLAMPSNPDFRTETKAYCNEDICRDYLVVHCGNMTMKFPTKYFIRR